ncbi:beta-N-acetylhexosaminidase [Thiomicrorhabdus sp. 6S2-11]|uniref:Beta-hexosaminidase n=1 Tax=Thiomicrorhabdus marina TaxID=2818442 RepID=A0ABS3Q3N0_9GAMM|nr:beta-N-acetylhexosaminidase [Thiomicrorhabdus marina]MBO1926708.1 beta-N-acetylhexosaminidase [Thiomicrorhabdus marina]
MQQNAGRAMSLGSIMIDLQGTSMTAIERERLMDSKVAGVILFTRNFESVAQLQELTKEIHRLRHPRLLVAVDHEGGRVQRFRDGFTRLPPMRLLGRFYQNQPKQALELAHKTGWLMAAELLACGVDFSFAPVLDLDYGGSKVIGDRSFSEDSKVVAELSLALIQGMQNAGMASVGKHFPGHGYIEADTHLEIAVDQRSLHEIQKQDMQPFLKLIENGLDAVMPAHVIYPQVDAKPAGFSEFWLQRILREQCHFEGAIISDDMSMQAAVEFGDASQRVRNALQAGCDLVLVCNDPHAADKVLSEVTWQGDLISHARLIRMHGHHQYNYDKLRFDPQWQAAVHLLDHLNSWAERNLHDETQGSFSGSLL